MYLWKKKTTEKFKKKIGEKMVLQKYRKDSNKRPGSLLDF